MSTVAPRHPLLRAATLGAAALLAVAAACETPAPSGTETTAGQKTVVVSQLSPPEPMHAKVPLPEGAYVEVPDGADASRLQRKIMLLRGEPYLDSQVEKPVVQAPGSPAPRYPDELRTTRIQGEVLARFVVDTLGRVEPGSFEVLKASNARLSQAVRDALPSMRFVPAEVSGHKVRQVVQQPFMFVLSR